MIFAPLRTMICLIILSVSLQLVAGQRPDINSFTSTQRTQLRNLIIDYVSANNDAVINEHQTSPGIHNYDEVFLTWHREYIAGLESYLMSNGGSQFVPLPAYNPNGCIPDELFDNAVAPGFDALDNQCPSGFNFSRFNSSTFCDNYSGNASSTFCGRTRSRPIDKFAADLECEHDPVHGSIGGSMGFIPTAPAAAIFWLYHAWIDDIYYDYEDCLCSDSSLSLASCNPPFLGVYWIDAHRSGGHPWSNYQWYVWGAGTIKYDFGGPNIGVEATNDFTVLVIGNDACGNTRYDVRSYDPSVCGSDNGGFGGFGGGFKVSSSENIKLRNYPNPFNEQTVIEYQLVEETRVTINVFDVTGKVVWEFEDDLASPGTHQAVFKASDLPNGIYYSKIVAGNETQLIKLILQKETILK